MQEKLALFKDKLRLIRKYSHALGILNFDFQTCAPEQSREEEGEVIDFFANELFKIATADEMKALIVELYDNRASLEDPLDVSLVEKWYDEYQKTKNITPEFDLKMNNVYSKAYSAWLKAKKNADYSEFRDSLAEVVDIQRQAIALRENKLDDYYDNCLDDCEKGVLQADLDPFFAELKEGLISLLNRIKGSRHVIRRDFLTRSVPIHKQEAFSRYLLELNGYDFSKGALSTTEHPFTIDIAENDSRVTTHYYENLFVSNIFSVVHEGGHAIFMQNERKEDHEHFINDYITNGMHESVSRFYENVIGRSPAYIHLIYPKFHEMFLDELGDVSERELYEAVNIVEPSLVRTEADEVTYGLHIIIRYEMEKGIASGRIQPADVPKVWNALYKEYLGVDVPNDAEGVLQDVHWTSGFGYFPSYALGNSYNAMYYRRMQREIGVDDLVAKGDFETIKAWLRANVFAEANVLTPKEWLRKITGETLSPKAFLDYLNRKYVDLYQLE